MQKWRVHLTAIFDLAPPLRRGFPGGTSGKEATCQRRRPKRCEFNPWVGKMPWRRKE